MLRIPQAILDINQIFHQNNLQLYLVGGCVRDYIKNIEPHDYDLVTNASPDQIIEILSDKYKTELQGKQFGVIRLYSNNNDNNNENYEIATFRTDIANGRDTKSNNIKVNINNVTLEEDCERRDFTQNSLYYNINENKIIDLVNGVNDIKNNIIKCNGNPNQRFNEDKLRIIRCLRFSATNENSIIDQNTSLAIHNDNNLFNNKNIIDNVSKERIVMEMDKVNVKSKQDNKNYNAKFIKLLLEYKILNQIFPILKLNVDDWNINNNNFIDDINIVNNIVMNICLLFTIDYNLYYKTNNNNIETNFNEYKQQLKLNLINAKFDNDRINKILYLFNIVNSNDIYNTKLIYNQYKQKQRYKIDDKLLNQILNTINKNYLTNNKKQLIYVFNNYYKPNHNINEILEQGYKDKEITLQINNLESFNFIQTYTKYKTKTPY